jgi:hypothetical protein
MVIQTISNRIYEDFLQLRANNLQPLLTYEEFVSLLETWYEEFQAGECSLGYAADQLGITQIDFIYLLDELGWKATNL